MGRLIVNLTRYQDDVISAFQIERRIKKKSDAIAEIVQEKGKEFSWIKK